MNGDREAFCLSYDRRMKQLSSRHHPLVAACKALARGRADGDDGRRRLLLDGAHLVEDAMRAGLRLDTVAITDRALSSPEGRRLAERSAAAGAQRWSRCRSR